MTVRRDRRRHPGNLRALASDEARNRRILDDVIAAIEEGRSPILLTERKDHLEYFADRLRASCATSSFCTAE